MKFKEVLVEASKTYQKTKGGSAPAAAAVTIAPDVSGKKSKKDKKKEKEKEKKKKKEEKKELPPSPTKTKKKDLPAPETKKVTEPKRKKILMSDSSVDEITVHFDDSSDDEPILAKKGKRKH
jgi:hypothetical protein